MSASEVKLTWRGRLMAVAIGIVLVAGIAEIGLRFVAPHWRDFDSFRFMHPTAVPSRPLLVAGTPGFDGWFAQNNGDFRHRIRLNADGLRNDEPTAAAQGRIWIVGDSMSFGWGVEREHTYGEVLANELGERTFNIAAPGADVCGYQALVMRMPKDVRPKAVVLGLVLENDALPKYDCTKAAPAEEPVAMKAPDSLASLLGWSKRKLTESSALYNTAVPAIKRVEALNALLVAAGLIKPEHGYKRFFEADQIDAVARETAREIAGVRDLLPAEMPFVVLVIPARFEVRDGDAFYRRLRLEIIEELTRLRVPAVDVFEEFAAAGFAPTHFRHDGHWSAQGHAIAGKALAAWFKAGR